jgi:hypothetical protein
MINVLAQISIDSKGNVTFVPVQGPATDLYSVDSQGNITIPQGDVVVITFVPASGQTWSFNANAITITSPPANVTVGPQIPSAATINDNNSASGQYTYTISTSLKLIDPKIINRG